MYRGLRLELDPPWGAWIRPAPQRSPFPSRASQVAVRLRRLTNACKAQTNGARRTSPRKGTLELDSTLVPVSGQGLPLGSKEGVLQSAAAVGAARKLHTSRRLAGAWAASHRVLADSKNCDHILTALSSLPCTTWHLCQVTSWALCRRLTPKL